MNPLLKLVDHGQSYWLDNLTRDMIENGDLAHRVAEEGLRGITSNPSTFSKAIRAGDSYDMQIKASVAQGRDDVADIYRELVVTDIQSACDALKPVYEASGGGDGFVSLEVSPHLAHDTEASVEEARALWGRVDRPNLMIKVPGTAEGLPAIERLLYEGINVNVTLLFSVERYAEVAEAHMRALERRVEEGKPIDGIASVASFFLSRIDVLADKLLKQRLHPGRKPRDPYPAGLMGKVAVANAKRAYQRFKELTAADRWAALGSQGAKAQRLLWASTSTKNPDYDDLMYVEPLIGRETVNTLPEDTIAAFADHGAVDDTVERDVDAAEGVLDALAKVGIDLGHVARQLEDEGIQKFIDPYDELMAELEHKVIRFAARSKETALCGTALNLRRRVIEMTTEAGSGHPTSCMSCADIIAALFFHEMRWDPSEPDARDVDQFILSKGHAAPILWAGLAEAGALDENPMTLRKFDSTLEGHPTPRNGWVGVATGSLGQGLAAVNGIALANQLDGYTDSRVYCLLGDGELSEGAIWEAAQFASLEKLSSVVAIVDLNALAQSGAAPYGHDGGVIADRFRAFGWRVLEIDGHDMGAILDALFEARAGGPTAIVARTLKGRGVSFLEGEDGWHGKPLDAGKRDAALKELGTADKTARIKPRRLGAPMAAAKTPAGNDAPIEVSYEIGGQAATRKSFGQALAKLGHSMPDLVVLDGDVGNSTHTNLFKADHPGRFFQGHIAEQNAAGAALGLAASGKVPVFATFASFLSRAYDFARMAGHSRVPHLVFCGSHAGVSIGQDGPSQMGLEDLAMFRAVLGSTVLYPSDGVSAERLTQAAVRTEGPVYIRTTRGKTPVIYGNDEAFEVGGSKTLRESDEDAVTLVAAGITLHEALAAQEALSENGIPARVIDCYSVKPIDRAALKRAARETRGLIVAEDHFKEGGLGDAVAAEVSGLAPVVKLGVEEPSRSGAPEELLERHGLSAGAIEGAARELLAA